MTSPVTQLKVTYQKLAIVKLSDFSKWIKIGELGNLIWDILRETSDHHAGFKSKVIFLAVSSARNTSIQEKPEITWKRSVTYLRTSKIQAMLAME